MNLASGPVVMIVVGMVAAILRRPFALLIWTFQKALPGIKPELHSVEAGCISVAALFWGFGAWLLARAAISPLVGDASFIAVGGFVVAFSRTFGRIAWHFDCVLGIKTSDPDGLASIYRAAGIVTLVFGAFVTAADLLGR